MNGYDKWRTTPPERRESKLKCDYCGDELFPGERAYDIMGDTLCYKCANRWLDDQYRFVQEEECYGF